MKRRTLALALSAGALVIGLTAGTAATWISADGVEATPLAFGTLNLRSDTVMGSEGPIWLDTSVSEAPVLIDPDTFLATAGDVIRMGHYFTLDATGDNLNYEIDVRWDSAPTLTDGVTASYTLTENPGTADAVVHMLRAPLGTPLELPSASEGTRTFLLDIDLTYSASRSDRTHAQVALTDIGRFTISAGQTREGA